MEHQVIANRYEVQQRIGSGGVARVYRGRDRVLGREVAIKILNTDAASDPDFVERFRREAQAAAVLTHPNIAAIFDWGFVGDTYYMVMEYVAGPNLKEVLRAGPLPESEALTIAAQVAAALEAAHSRGVIHRDVKPHNVLLGSEEQVKVVDFGIARATGQTQLTRTNQICGTAHYLSPEQLQRLEVDGRSDVYSLGVVLYEMLTGIEPFRGDSLVEVALQHVHERPVPPRQLRDSVSPEAEAVVLKALAKHPANRYQSAAEMRRAALEARARQGKGQPERPSAPTVPRPQALEPTVRLAPVIAGTTPATGHVARSSPAMNRNEGAPPRPVTPWLIAVPGLIILLVAGVLLSQQLFRPSKSAALHERVTPVHLHKAGHAPVQHRRTPGPTPVSKTQAVHRGSRKVPTRVPGATSPPATSAPPRAAPTQPAPATQPTSGPIAVAGTTLSSGPVQTVQQFYGDISGGQLSEALALWSPGMKAEFDPHTNLYQRFADTRSIDILSATPAYVGDRTARVVVMLDEYKANTSTPILWTGSWDLIRGPDGWLLNYPHF